MASLSVTNNDVLALGVALDALGLPLKQRALLSAIVAIGASHPSALDVQDDPPSFSDQLAEAFIGVEFSSGTRHPEYEEPQPYSGGAAHPSGSITRRATLPPFDDEGTDGSDDDDPPPAA